MIDLGIEINQRAKEAPWVDNFKKLSILMIGAGGIGSNAAVSIAKNYPERFLIVDPDIVELHNAGNQLFPIDSLGKSKTEALREIIDMYCNYCKVISIKHDHSYYFREFEGLRRLDVVILAVDNMKARRETFEILNKSVNKGESKENLLFVDARQSATDSIIYAFNFTEKEKIEAYMNEALFTDEEAADLPCGFKSTMHTGQFTGSFITSIVCNHAANSGLRVPFKIHYNTLMMDFLVNE